MRAVALCLLAIVFAHPALSECVGSNLIDALSAEDRAALRERVAQHPYPEGNFWRATKGASTLHVVGTMHLADPRFVPMVNTVRPYVVDADTVFLEATEADMKALEARMLSDPSMMFIQTGPTLPDLLSEGDWARLTQRMEQRGIPGFFAAKMQPWYAAMMMGVPACAMDLMTERNGLDKRLSVIAEGAGVETRALEDGEALLRAFAEEPMDEQIDMLSTFLATDADEAAGFATMVDAYFAGKHRELWEFTILHGKSQPGRTPEQWEELFAEAEQALLIDRNIAWMDVLLPAVSEGNHVVAVGAAHLSGEDGVLNLLAEAGYTLERLD
ncbi:TraB/GumN family protein [Aliiroseovarius sp. YM-037]|uniref:TraB/GumN family protein n=1 Tax=Aliiroseovarius sp. YM-037 TaxID=3341728 RepID=UPI003A7FA33B